MPPALHPVCILIHILSLVPASPTLHFFGLVIKYTVPIYHTISSVGACCFTQYSSAEKDVLSPLERSRLLYLPLDELLRPSPARLLLHWVSRPDVERHTVGGYREPVHCMTDKQSSIHSTHAQQNKAQSYSPAWRFPLRSASTNTPFHTRPSWIPPTVSRPASCCPANKVSDPIRFAMYISWA